MKTIYTLLIALMMTCLGFGQTTIYTQDFELADTGYLSSNTEGSAFEDVFNRIDASAAAGGNIGGNSSFIWAVEDSNETPGSINLSQIDVTGYADFTFSIDMLAHHFEDWDSTDELLITYSIDSGASENLLWVQMVPNPSNAGDNFNGPAALDTDFDGGGDCGAANTLPALTTGTQHGCTVSASDFATFSSAVISLNGNSTLDITLEFNGMTSGDEGIYLDDILVEGNLAGGGCTEPFQASSFTTLFPSATDATIEFTRGGGDDVLVVMREGSAVDADPTSGTSYTANSIFNGPGASEIGTGNYVVFNGNNGTSNPGVGGASLSIPVSGLTSETTYHLAVYEYNTVDTCYNLTELAASFTTLAETSIQFTSTSASVSEGSGTYDLIIEIANEDATNATTFDVVLSSGDAADINSYTTQSLSFAAGSGTDETLTITITDDGTFEANETLTFEIQNVTGGLNASVGANSTFDLTITNNDPPATIGLPYSEDFTDCNTAQWLPFSESGSNSWSCASGEYTMNGFPNPDDVDWLISNFSIDFELTTNENIAVTTSERFGDDINDPGEFELRYSNDYPGFGDPTIWTWTALAFDPNNTSTGATPSADSVTVVDASGISGTAYLAFFYDMTAGSGAEEWIISDVLIQEGALPTSVELVSTSATVEENSVSYDLEFIIANEDATNATTFDVALTSGDAADIDSYTTQLVTFAAGDAINQIVTVNITDDAIEEGDEIFTFEIQNVAGGNAATVGTNSTFNLTISENDIAGLLYDADFSNDGDGFPAHSTVDSPNNLPAPGPASAGPFGTVPNQWTLSYDNTPGTDGSDNSFEVSGGALVSDDWGGQGIFTSQVIDVSAVNVVDITAQGFNVGANDDVFVYFYIIDGGTRVETDLGVTNDGDPVNYSVLGLDVSGATSLEVGFEFSENGGNSGYEVSEFIVIEGVAETSVEFASTSDTIIEDAGTYDLTFEITFEDAMTATTFDVVLTSGDAADIGGYTTQSVNFPAGNSGDQSFTVTITDDMLEESSETFTFEIQNVSGGNNAAVGVNNTFNLTIQDNDGFSPLPGDIVISEIMYNSSGTDDEWVELYNASGADITLDASWRLTYGGSTFDFAGTVITDGSYVTVAIGSNGDGIYNIDNPFTPDVSIFSLPADAGTTSNANQLLNSSTTIALTFEPSGSNITIDTVTYDDGAPWPTAADGDGPSLELIDVSFDNTDGANWVASGLYDGGTPGAQYVAPVVYTFNGTWSPSNPNGTATAGDDIVVASGDATFDTNTTCNSVTVNAGAGLIINTGITVTSTNGLTLESTSTSYSSLLGDGTVTGTIEYERFTNSNPNGNDLISAPLGGQSWTDFIGDFPNFLNLLDDGGTPTTYAFGPFSKTAGTFVNYDENTIADLTSGVGYRAATDSGDILLFTGTPLASAVSLAVGNSGPNNEEWNLVGNPYASYMDAASFLSANGGVFEPGTFGIWGYDGNAANGWTLVNLATVSGNPLVAPGQGFFISCVATTNTINFDPSWRSTGSSDDYIPGRLAPLQYMVLNVDSGDKSFHTDFYVNSAASEGFDIGYDAELWDAISQDFRVYSHLVQDNSGNAIALQTMDAESLTEATIPLGVHANQGEQFTFSIAETTLPDAVNVYLDDVVTNTTTLLNTSDYVITPTNDLSGTGRFFLRYSEDALSTIENDIESLNIFALNTSKEIIVSGQLQDASTLEVYDIQGRAVLAEALDSKNLENRINVSTLSAGVYVVSVQNNAGQKTQKVILK